MNLSSKKQNVLLSMTALTTTLMTVGFAPPAYAASPLCSSGGNSVAFEWISRFQLNGTSNTISPAGYVDLTGNPSPFGSVVAGTNYPAEIDVTTNGGPYGEFVKIWLDLNQDGAINPTGELLFDQAQLVGEDTTATFTGNINVPTTAFNGDMVGRVIMQFNGAPALCAPYDYGTTLDFNVEITGATDNPAAPQAVTAVSAVAGAGQATVSFTPPASGPTPTGYTITAQPGGTVVTTTSGSPVVFPGLTNGTEYTFTVTPTIAPLLTGPASTVSNAVTPKAPPLAPPLPELTDATNSGSTADTITNIDPATVSGTAEADSTVEVFLAGVSVGTTTAGGSGDWTFTFDPGEIVDGDNVVTVTATDAIGSTSPVSPTLTVTFDDTVAAPDSLALTGATNSGSTTDTLTNVAEAQITGTAEANSEVEISVGGVSVGTATTNASGEWSYTFGPTQLATGDNTVTAAATDVAGNVSSASSSLVITLDETDPTAATGLALSDATNSGSTTDTLTNVAEAQITGTAEANSEVEVSVGGVSVGTATTNASGEWSYTFGPTQLSTGDNSVTTVVSDEAGNTSPVSSALTITLDEAVAAPTAALADASNSGVLTDTITNVTAPQIEGTAEANSAVEVFVGGASVGIAMANGSGEWVLPLADGIILAGDNVITTVATDLAGNVSPASAPVTITLDTDEPTAPGGLALADATNSGSIADVITNVAEAQITGTAEANSEVEVSVGGVSVGTATTNPSGEWSYTFGPTQLAAGDNSVTAVATDVAGNASLTSAPFTITLDQALPSAPTDVALTDATNSGSTADTETNIAEAQIEGTTEANATVEVFVGTTSVGTATADPSGAWDFTFAPGQLATGDNVVTVATTDIAGNTSSPASAPLTITFDGDNTGPSGLALTDATNSGELSDTVTNVAEAEITGTAEPGASVDVLVGGVSVGMATANPSGDWSFTFADGNLAQGDNSITTVATDVAANVSAPSAPLIITLDEGVPGAAGSLMLADATNSGSLSDTLTNVAEAMISGTAEPNAIVEIFVGGASVGTVSADPSGVWDFTFVDGSLAQGDNTITTIVTDDAGNASPSSTALIITLDDSAPAQPLGLALDDGSNSGDLTDAVTNNTAPQVSGTAEPNSTVDVLVGGVSVGTATTDAGGAWDFTLPDGTLAEGDNLISTVATDAAGNTSDPSAPLTITQDTAAPDAPVGLDLSDATNSGDQSDTITNVSAPEIGGTAEPNSEIEVFVGGMSVGVATTNVAGDWTFAFVDGNLVEGDNSITTAATDAAGNTSAASAPLTITLDLSVPAPAPAIEIADGSNSGSTDDALTNNATPEIGGTAEPGSSVEVFVGGVAVGTAITDETGTWAFTFVGGDLSEGDNVVTVAVTDTSGNTSPLSPPQTIALDTISPGAMFAVPTGPQSGPFEASVTFSEPVEGLDVGDFDVPNVTISELTTTDNMTFTFTVTPEVDGEITLMLAADAANDAAENGSTMTSRSLVASDSTAPTVIISGPTTAVTDVFEVSAGFSEPVSGFTADDIVVTGGTLSNFRGDGEDFTFDITPILGEMVTVSIADSMAQDVAGNNNVAARTFAVRAGSPLTEFEAAEEEVRDAVIADAERTLTNRISSQRKMIENARTRFIADRRNGRECISDENRRVECPENVSRNSVPLDVTGEFTLRGEEISTRGSFFGQTYNAEGDASRVVSGDFNITRDDDGSVAALISGRVAWESARNENTLLGYYLGGDLARSNIEGSFDGSSSGFGLSVGSYVVREFSENVYADGYASVGYGFTDLELSDDTLALNGKHSGLTVLTGASLTGVYARNGWEIWPQIGLDYGYSDVGVVDFDAQAYGLFDTVSLDAGSVEILQLSIAPEIKVALSGAVEGRDSTTLTLTPKLVCQSVNGTQSTSDCGWGAGVGINSRFNDGLSNFDAGIQLERINDRTTTALQLAYERKF